jgi:hypothetical protein
MQCNILYWGCDPLGRRERRRRSPSTQSALYQQCVPNRLSSPQAPNANAPLDKLGQLRPRATCTCHVPREARSKPWQAAPRPRPSPLASAGSKQGGPRRAQRTGHREPLPLRTAVCSCTEHRAQTAVTGHGGVGGVWGLWSMGFCFCCSLLFLFSRRCVGSRQVIAIGDALLTMRSLQCRMWRAHHTPAHHMPHAGARCSKYEYTSSPAGGAISDLGGAGTEIEIAREDPSEMQREVRWPPNGPETTEQVPQVTWVVIPGLGLARWGGARPATAPGDT